MSVTDAVDWKAGDTIVLATSDYYDDENEVPWRTATREQPQLLQRF